MASEPVSPRASDAILARLLDLHPKSIDLSLGRMTRLLDALGNPERAMPPVIHVAGTNGKGSVVTQWFKDHSSLPLAMTNSLQTGKSWKITSFTGYIMELNGFFCFHNKIFQGEFH